MQSTNQALSVACDAFGLPAVMVTPQGYGAQPLSSPQSGDFLYRASTCTASRQLEQALWQPGVIGFYDDDFFEFPYQEEMTVNSPVSLQGPFQLTGPPPVLVQDFEHARAYRLIIVGNRLIAAGVLSLGRGHGGSSNFVQADPPREAIYLALRAMQAARIEVAAAEVLEDKDGKLALVELEFPCNFLELQHCSQTKIADAMVAYLVRKRCVGVPKIEPKPSPSRPNTTRTTCLV